MIKHFLHIIRWPNLLMVVIIQVIVYMRLLLPGDSVLGPFDFGLLTIITVLLAASGFVINDYYDTRIDSINRPDKWIAGNSWALSSVKKVYIILLSLGGILACLLALRLVLMPWILVYPIAALGLWFYSYALKCRPILGNLWVSLFCGLVLLIVALPDLLMHNTGVIRQELWFFMAFAFLATWYREIVKDLEDEKGDKEVNCQTFVVRFGVKYGKILSLVFGIILLATLVWWESVQSDKIVQLVLTVLQGAIVASMAFIWWAKDNTYFHNASTVIKVVMLAGTCLLLII